MLYPDQEVEASVMDEAIQLNVSAGSQIWLGNRGWLSIGRGSSTWAFVLGSRTTRVDLYKGTDFQPRGERDRK